MDHIREMIIEYYEQEYGVESSVMQAIYNAKTFHLHKYGECIVADNRILPMVIEKEETKKGMRYKRINVPEAIIKNLPK